MKFSIAIYSSLLFIKLNYLPNIDLLAWLFIMVLFDFITGFIKARVMGVARTSKGMRATVIKLIQYVGVVTLVIVLGNVVGKEHGLIEYVDDGVFIFIIYIEAVSVLENLVAIAPNSAISKKVFEPLLKLLTISMDKLPLSNLKDKITDGKVLAIATLLFATGCTIVKPQQDTSYVKTDSLITGYKKIGAEYKGATVNSSVNNDSLFKLFFQKIESIKNYPGTNSNLNYDSLYKAFKASLKPVARDTTIVTDPQTKVQLKYWYDEFGKLQMSCTSKDYTIQLMVAEITRLTKEVTKAKTVEVVYKMPNWGWIVIGVCSIPTIIVLVWLFFSVRDTIKGK